MSKTLWIIANWKSNKTIAEALEWVSLVGPKISRDERLKIVVCPPFLDVEEVKKAVLVGNYPLMVGVQDLSPYEPGPYTGEEAAALLKDIVELAILGHPERRRNFSETDQLVAEKVEEARKYNIIPLVCVASEVTPVPEGVNLVAYEPEFAIGTGEADDPDNANRVAKSIKSKIEGAEILYGGSIEAANAGDFLTQSELSGLLIGKSSLDANEFLKIINLAWKTLDQ